MLDQVNNLIIIKVWILNNALTQAVVDKRICERKELTLICY